MIAVPRSHFDSLVFPGQREAPQFRSQAQKAGGTGAWPLNITFPQPPFARSRGAPAAGKETAETAQRSSLVLRRKVVQLQFIPVDNLTKSNARLRHVYRFSGARAIQAEICQFEIG